MEKQGKLELTWVGKYEEEKLEPRIFIEDEQYSYGDTSEGNMLIHGDNLIALEALQQEYTDKIKCIYIDPPYNTGSAFEHYDDGVEHSIWLSLMRKRLILLRNLLSDDGFIFVQIDNNEMAYLKILMDEMPIIPLSYRNSQLLINTKVTGVIKSYIGHTLFKYGDIEA